MYILKSTLKVILCSYQYCSIHGVRSKLKVEGDGWKRASFIRNIDKQNHKQKRIIVMVLVMSDVAQSPPPPPIPPRMIMTYSENYKASWIIKLFFISITLSTYFKNKFSL